MAKNEFIKTDYFKNEGIISDDLEIKNKNKKQNQNQNQKNNLSNDIEKVDIYKIEL